MTIIREERIGNQRLILGDCLQVMPLLGKVDAVVTDPPYGINFDYSRSRVSRSDALAFAAGTTAETMQRGWSNIHGDDQPFDPRPFLDFKHVILWGGQNFAHLPPSRGWLIWDKRRDTAPDNFGDAEMAWTNLDMVVRMHRQLWRGIVREGEENVSRGPKLHPAQKPVALMEWCLSFIPPSASVLDPYMGCGTTIVACQRLGRHGVGIEIDPAHFETACRRVDEASRQPNLLGGAA